MSDPSPKEGHKQERFQYTDIIKAPFHKPTICSAWMLQGDVMTDIRGSFPQRTTNYLAAMFAYRLQWGGKHTAFKITGQCFCFGLHKTVKKSYSGSFNSFDSLTAQLHKLHF